MCSDDCFDKTKYGIGLQSKLTMNDNMRIIDQMSRFKKWIKAEDEKHVRKIDHALFEKKKSEVNREILKL